MSPPERLTVFPTRTRPTRLAKTNMTPPDNISPSPEKAKATDHEVKRALAKLKALVGNITTTSQAIIASHWLDKIRLDGESLMNDQAWMMHVPRDDPSFLRIWDTMSFYRILGEPPAFVIPEDWKPNDREMDELGLLNERWVFLAGEGELGNLEDNDYSRAVKERGGSLAERLKAYLEAYKDKIGFEKWNETYIENAKHCVVEVYDAFFKRTGRPHFKSGTSTGAQLHRNISSITTTEVPYQDIIAEAALLRTQLGRLQTTEEVRKAAEYSDPLVKGPRAEIQKEAFEHYILRSCHSGRVAAEIEMYKLIRQSSAYFGSPQHFNSSAIQELAKVVRDWVSLEAQGLLSTLVEKGYYGASVPARLKQYMELYKSQEQITRLIWTVEDLKGLRFSLLTDQFGILDKPTSTTTSIKRQREPTPPLETESRKRMKESATESLNLIDPTFDSKPPLPAQRTPLPSQRHPWQPTALSSNSNLDPLQFPIADSTASTSTSASPSPRPRGIRIYIAQVQNIIQGFNSSSENAASKISAFNVAFKNAEEAKPLLQSRQGELSKATSDMWEGSKNPEFINSENWTALLAEITRLGGEVRRLTDIIATEKTAREERDLATSEHQRWKTKMEALDRVIDDPGLSSG